MRIYNIVVKETNCKDVVIRTGLKLEEARKVYESLNGSNEDVMKMYVIEEEFN